MKFIIFHPADGSLNQDCRTDITLRRIAILEAENISDAFYKGQNDFNEAYAAKGHRSTSVGDVIMNVEDQKTYMVEGSCFKQIAHDFKDDEESLPLI